jgi:hypothetical protein
MIHVSVASNLTTNAKYDEALMGLTYFHVANVPNLTYTLLPYDCTNVYSSTPSGAGSSQLLWSNSWFVKITGTDATIRFVVNPGYGFINFASCDLAVHYLGETPILRPGVALYAKQVDKNAAREVAVEENIDWLLDRDHIAHDDDDEQEDDPINSTPVHIEMEEKQDGRWLSAGKLDNIAPRTVAMSHNHSR